MVMKLRKLIIFGVGIDPKWHNDAVRNTGKIPYHGYVKNKFVPSNIFYNLLYVNYTSEKAKTKQKIQKIIERKV